MRLSILPHLALLLLLLIASHSNAQFTNVKSKDNLELYFSDGLLSTTEVVAWAGDQHSIQLYRSFPSWLTGPLMATCRYYISNRVGVGVSIGMDNLGGDLSYGNEHSYIYQYGTISGRYVRQQYTIAPEVTFIYYKGRHVMLYGGAGLGITVWKEQYKFDPGIAHATAFYGPTGMVPANPYAYNGSHVNAQITGFGVRAGDDWAFFAEVGVGYKGLANIGVSRRLIDHYGW